MTAEGLSNPFGTSLAAFDIAQAWQGTAQNEPLASDRFEIKVEAENLRLVPAEIGCIGTAWLDSPVRAISDVVMEAGGQALADYKYESISQQARVLEHLVRQLPADCNATAVVNAAELVRSKLLNARVAFRQSRIKEMNAFILGQTTDMPSQPDLWVWLRSPYSKPPATNQGAIPAQVARLAGFCTFYTEHELPYAVKVLTGRNGTPGIYSASAVLYKTNGDSQTYAAAGRPVNLR